MQTETQAAVQRAENAIENLKVGILTLRGLPDLQCVHRVTVADTSGSIFISVRYDIETYRHNRKVLFDDGWSITKAFVTTGGNRHSWLEKEGRRVVYVMDLDATGSTCVREKVGEKIKDIYRVSCK